MYPYLRLLSTLIKARYRRRLELEDCARLHSRVGITDIDPFLDFNHARQILYFELGRWDYSQRVGFVNLMREHDWGITVGGISIRYRRRVSLLQPFTVTTKPICHDGRWFYFLQEILRRDELCTSALIKAGAVSKTGLVTAAEVLAAMGRDDWGREIPDWVGAWIDAEGQRPWSTRNFEP